jgi:hypothetical protein
VQLNGNLELKMGMKQDARAFVTFFGLLALIALALKGWANAYLNGIDLRKSECSIAYLKTGRVPASCNEFGPWPTHER